MKSNKNKERIGYAVGSSSLGKVLVASSEMGMVAVLIGEDAKSLIRDLQQRFPEVDPCKGAWDAEAALTHVITFIEKPTAKFDLPLYMRGTPFQKRVWRAVQEIPVGQTASYSDIALKIGAPRAMRAVGSTCTKNNHFIVIPCHRVTRRDGSASAWQHMLIDREVNIQKNKGRA